MWPLKSPSLWVYVWYKSERALCVANTDGLDLRKAQMFKRSWGDDLGRTVTRVTLQDAVGHIYKEYTF